MKIKISFKLKDIRSEESPVIMMVNFGYKEYDSLKDKYIYKPLKYYTGLSVKTSQWDNKKKLPTTKQAVTKLLKLEETSRKVFDYLVLEKVEITPSLLKEEIDLKVKGVQKIKQRIRIVDFIEQVILTGTSRGKGTLRNYRKLANKIIAFEESKGKQIYLDDINEQLWLEFKKWLQNRLGRMNSVWDILKNLKATLNEISRKYKIEVFQPAKELAKIDKVSLVLEDKVFFDFNHIQTIIEYQPKTESLKNVKGILLTLLFTGCRYSDVFKIKPEYTYQKNGLSFNYSRYVSEKSNKDVIVPILKPLSDFYAENDGKIPYRISDVKFNRYVKDLVELAEIKDEITLSYTNAKGRKEYDTKKFYEFVTSHIGRRSFITNLINYVPITILTKITGHRLVDKSVIFGYNKISLEENAALFVKELKRQMEANPTEFTVQLI